MISITMMLIISTLQSSIDKMVPKTSYLKMVDVFLIYSFNIVIVIMGVHTYMDMCIHRDDITGLIVDSAASSRPSSKDILHKMFVLYSISEDFSSQAFKLQICDCVNHSLNPSFRETRITTLLSQGLVLLVLTLG